MLDKEFLLAVLKLTMGKNFFTAAQLAENVPLPKTAVLKYLNSLAEENLTSKRGELFAVTSKQKIGVAVKAAMLGCPTNVICRYLSWQEFEQIIQYALKQNGYETLRHQRLRVDGGFCELDIIGVHGQIVLGVDCKHWKISSSKASIRKAAEAQLRRVKKVEINKNMEKIEKSLGRELRGTIKVVPVIVTLTETPFKVCSGVPVVPILKFGSFLNELLGYVDVFETSTVCRS